MSEPSSLEMKKPAGAGLVLCVFDGETGGFNFRRCEVLFRPLARLVFVHREDARTPAAHIANIAGEARHPVPFASEKPAARAGRLVQAGFPVVEIAAALAVPTFADEDCLFGIVAQPIDNRFHRSVPCHAPVWCTDRYAPAKCITPCDRTTHPLGAFTETGTCDECAAIADFIRKSGERTSAHE